MKLFTNKHANTKHVTHFDSNFFLSRLAKTSSATRIGIATLEAGGIIGIHQANVPQLLVVIEGTALVRNDTSTLYELDKGEAVYWEKGEIHETRTQKGLTALLIESEDVHIIDLLESSK